MVTLKNVIDIFESVSLSHVDIKQFHKGTSFGVAISPTTVYPIAFLEIPITMNYGNDRRLKTYNFAYHILLKGNQDDIVKDIDLVSYAEDIGDSILSKIQNDYKSSVIINNVNGLSLTEFSDDMLSGVRFEMQVSVTREYTAPKCYKDKFEEAC